MKHYIETVITGGIMTLIYIITPIFLIKIIKLITKKYEKN